MAALSSAALFAPAAHAVKQPTDTFGVVARLPATLNASALQWNGGDTLYALQGNFQTGFYAYSISRDTWITRTAAPDTSYNPSVTRIDGQETLYVLRQVSSTLVHGHRDLWAYVPSVDQWVSLAQTPDTVRGGSIVWGGVGDTIYALRGSNRDSFWAYSPSRNDWSTLARMDSIVASTVGSAMAIVPGGETIYVARGGGSVGPTPPRIYGYVPSRDTWRMLASVSINTFQYPAITWGGTGDTLYITASGGYYTFVPSRNEVVLAGFLPSPSAGHGLAWGGLGDTLYALGGNNGDTFYQHGFPAPYRGPIWHVNDTSQAGDSFTNALGSDTGDGSKTRPFLYIDSALASASAGETISIDAGTYNHAASIAITVGDRWIIGADSALTIIDFLDKAQNRTLEINNVSNVRVRDLRITRAGVGVTISNNADSLEFTRIKIDDLNSHGFNVAGTSDTNTFRSLHLDGTGTGGGSHGMNFGFNSSGHTFETNLVESFGSNGFNLLGSRNNVIRSNRAVGNTGRGWVFNQSGNNQIVLNTAERNGNHGFEFLQSQSGNRVLGNMARNNGTVGSGSGFLIGQSVTNAYFASNTADSNRDWAFDFANDPSLDTFTKNIINTSPINPDQAVRNGATAGWNFDFTRNAWMRAGVLATDSAVIRNMIGGANANLVLYTPFRLGLVDTVERADTVAPKAPDTVVAAALSSNGIRVTWSAVTASEEPETSVGLLGYTIYRSRTADTSLWVIRGSVGLVDTFDDSGIFGGETWFYRVTARDNHTPFPNESFFSDSIAGCTTPVYAGPKWYVNDTSTAGDSFSAGVGSDSGDGSMLYPFLRIDSALARVGHGETILVDAGIFQPSAGCTIPQSGVFLIGVDSIVSRIDFVNQGAGKALFAANCTGLTISDLAISRGEHGIRWFGVTTSRILRVRADTHSQNGFYFSDRSDTNAITNSRTSNNTNQGVYLDMSQSNTITSHRSTGNTNKGIYGAAAHSNAVEFSVFDSNADVGMVFAAGSGGNSLRSNTVISNTNGGIVLNAAGGNSILSNTVTTNGAIGVNLVQADSNTLVGNVVTRNATHGFRLGTSHLNTVEANLVGNNQGRGFVLDASESNSLARNIIDSNVSWAVSIENASSGDTFRKNTIVTSPLTPGLGVFQNATSGAIFDFVRNAWKHGGILTTDSSQIRGMIAGSGFDSVTFHPWRLGDIDSGTLADTVAPRAPDTVAATAFSSSQIRVTWSTVTASEEGETTLGLAGYSIFRSATIDTSLWVRRGSTGLVNSFVDSGIPQGTGYYYRVTAFDDHSPYRNESFLSDSIALDTTLVLADTTGPNAWYVNDSSASGDSFTTAVGSDANNGREPASPLRTFNALLWRLTAGDTVYIDSGVWSESFIVMADSITIIGAGRESTILQGQADAITVTNKAAVRIRNLGFKNQSITGILITGTPNSTVEQCKFTAAFCAIHIDSTYGALVQDNYVTQTNFSGAIRFARTSLSTARRNVIENGVWGFQIDDAGAFSDSNYIYQNSFHANEQAFIMPGNGGVDRGNVIQKNIIISSTGNPNLGTSTYTDAGHLDLRRNFWMRAGVATTDSARIRGMMAGAHDSNLYIPFRLGPVDTSAGADTVAPKAPDTVAVTPLSQTSYRVTWSPVTTSEEPETTVGLAGYTIFRSRLPDTTVWAACGTANNVTLFYDDAGLLPNIQYYYRVTAFDDHVPYRNESFYSDSIATVDPIPDTLAANKWYVNDTSTVGDSYTTAVGYDTQSGLTRSTPFRTLGKLEGLLTEGDTVYIDAGYYYENDTFTIDTNAVFIIGVDSAATIIRFNDVTNASARAIRAANLQQLTIRNLAVERGLYGLWLTNVDSSRIERVRLDSHGFDGVILDFGADSNTLTGSIASGNTFKGIFLNGCINNAISANTVFGNGGGGIQIDFSNSNTLTSNVVRGNSLSGFTLNNSSNNTVTLNAADSNADWGYRLDGTSASNTFQRNNFAGSPTRPDSGALNNTANAVTFTRNWWGTTDSGGVAARIWGQGRQLVVHTPYRLGPVDTTPGVDTVAPRAPDSVVAGAAFGGGCSVTWIGVTSNEDGFAWGNDVGGYRIYRSSASDSSHWQRLGAVGASAREFWDSSAANFVRHYYRVTAYDNKLSYENEAYFSDSIGSGMALPDTSGANIWYVNDTSTTGDSFTSAVGYDTNHGQLPSAPVRSLNWLEGKLTPGDTIYIDAGFYYENDTWTIDTSRIFITGVDSLATVIRFPDSTVHSIHGVNINTVTVMDLQVTNARYGILAANGDTWRIERVWAGRNRTGGIVFNTSSESVSVLNSVATQNSGHGINISGGFTTVSGCSVSNNATHGIAVSGGTGGSLVTRCVVQGGHSTYGYDLVSTGGSVTSCTALDNSGRGFGGTAGTIIDCLARGNGTGGFHVQGSQRIERCSSTQNSGYGIALSQSGEASECVSDRNGGDGLMFIFGGGTPRARYCIIRNNAGDGVEIDATQSVIYSVEIDSNAGWAVRYINGLSGSQLSASNIRPPAARPDSGVFNGNTLNFALQLENNWWGTRDSTAIRRMISGTTAAKAESVVTYPFRLSEIDTRVNADTVAPKSPDTVALMIETTVTRVSWRASTGSEYPESNARLTGYVIWGADSTGAQAWNLVGRADASAQAFDDTGTTGGPYLVYRVSAFDNAPIVNISWYSDSKAFLDTSVRNTWYVNDTSTSGDSFTTRVGSDTHLGYLPGSPFRTLNKALSVVTPGDTIILDAGTWTESMVVPVDSITIVGVGATSSILSPGAGVAGITATGRNHVTIRNLGITGGAAGVAFINVDLSTIRNIRVYSAGETGIALTDGSETNTVYDNVVDSSGSSGIALYGSSSLSNAIDSNLVQNGRRFGIHSHEADSNRVTNNRIEGNDSHGIYLRFADTMYVAGNRVYNSLGARARGISIESASQNHVFNNVVDSMPYDGIHLQGTFAGSNVIDSNAIVGALRYGLFADQADSNMLTRNRISGTSSGPGIQLTSADTNYVAGNAIVNCGQGGIFLVTAHSCTVYNNTVDTVNNHGISSVGDLPNAIDSNRVTSTGAAGINVGDWTTVTNNVVTRSSDDGISLSGADSCVVVGNHVRQAGTSGSGDGIELNIASNNLVLRNVIDSSASHGLNLFATRRNLFFQNTIQNNGGWAIRVFGVVLGDTFNRNIILGAATRPDSFLLNASAASLACTRNWFGTTDSARLARGIVNTGGGTVLFTPYRLGLVDTALGADTVAPRASDTVALETAGQSCTVTWSASAVDEEGGALGDLAGYRVYRAVSATPDTWGLVGQTAAGVRRFVDTGPFLGGITYFWRVTAVDSHAIENQSFFSDTIAASPMNTAPVIQPAVPSETRPEDTPAWTINLHQYAYDQDAVDTNFLYWTVSGGGTYFTATLLDSRTLRIAPRADLYGSETILLTLCDRYETTSQTCTITLTPTNDTPYFTSAVPSQLREEETTPWTVALGGYATDTDANDTLVLFWTVTGNNIVVRASMSDSRTILLTPIADAAGTETLTLRVSDNQSTTSQPLAVTLTNTHDTPYILPPVPDITTFEDTPTFLINLNANGQDSDAGDTFRLFWTVAGGGNIGVFSMADSRHVQVATIADRIGTDTVTIAVSDNQSTTTQQLRVTLTNTNDPPYFAPLVPTQIRDEETTPWTVSLTQYGQDTDIGDTLILFFTVIGDGINFVPTMQDSRTLLLAPVLDRVGTETVTLRVSDNKSTTTQLLAVTLLNVNDTPFVNPTISIPAREEDTDPWTFFLGSYGRDTDNNDTFILFWTVTAGGTVANLSMQDSRTLLITPILDRNGTETVILSVSDNRSTGTQPVGITLHARNDSPFIAPLIPSQTREEDTAPWTVNLTSYGNDTDIGDTLIHWWTVTGGGTVVTASMQDSRTLLVTPIANRNGTETLILKLNDFGKFATQSITVTLNAVNDTPSIDPPVPAQVESEDTAAWNVALSSHYTDVDAGDSLISFWTVTGGGTVVTATMLDTRTLRLTPIADRFGTETLTIRASDGQSTTSQLLPVTLVAVNDVPYFIGTVPAQSRPEDTTAWTVSLTGLAGDTDAADSPILFFAVSGGGVRVIASMLDSRTLYLIPRADANGTETLTLAVSDHKSTTTQLLAVTLTPVNDTPYFTGTVPNQAREEDTLPWTVTLGGFATDTDAGDTAILFWSVAGGGTVITPSMQDSRTLLITPIQDRNGTETITLRVSDNQSTTTQQLGITLTAQNDTPRITPAIPAVVTVEDTPSFIVAVGAYGTDTDPGDTLILYWTVTGGGTVLTAAMQDSRTLRITPRTDSFGTETVTVAVSDGTSTTTQALAVTLAPVNDTPIARATADSTSFRPVETTTLRSTGTIDTDADNLTYAWTVETGTGGAFTSATAATTGFQPDTGFTGTYAIKLTVTDSAGASASASLALNIDGTPPAAFSLSAPADGHETTNTALDLSWSASSDTGSGLAGYTLQIIGPGGSFGAPLYTANAASGSTALRLTLPGSDTYQWRVVARDHAGNTTAASPRTILVDTALPAVPTPLSPVAAAETSSLVLTFRWTASSDSHAGLAHYRLQVARGTSGFASLLADLVVAPGLTETTPTVAFTVADTYSWRVWAVDDLGNASAVAWVESFVRRTGGETYPPLPVSTATVSTLETGGLLISWSSSPSADVVQYLIFWDSGLGGGADTLYAVVGGNGGGTLVTPAFPAGKEFRFTIVPVDSAGNLGVAAPLTAVRDTRTYTFPTGMLLTPPPGSRIAAGQAIQVLFQLDSPAQVPQVARFRYFYRSAPGGAWLQMAAAAGILNNSNPQEPTGSRDELGNYRFVWDAAALAVGEYDIRIVTEAVSGESRVTHGSGLRLVSPATDSPTLFAVVNTESFTNYQVMHVARGETFTITNNADTFTARIFVPAGAFPSATDTAFIYIIMSATPRTSQDPALPSSQKSVGEALSVRISNGDTALAGGAAATVTLTFQDRNQDGFVDGTDVRWDRLAMYRHTEVPGEAWVEMPITARQDPTATASGWIQTQTTRFSIFRLVGTGASTGLAGLVVTPNPFRPNDGDPRSGEEYTGAAGTGIYFLNVPAQVRIEVFSILGRKVVDYRTTNSNGQIQWDVRNDDRQPVASGVYLYIVTDLATNERKTGKLVIVR